MSIFSLQLGRHGICHSSQGLAQRRWSHCKLDSSEGALGCAGRGKKTLWGSRGANYWEDWSVYCVEMCGMPSFTASPFSGMHSLHSWWFHIGRCHNQGQHHTAAVVLTFQSWRGPQHWTSKLAAEPLPFKDRKCQEMMTCRCKSQLEG